MNIFHKIALQGLVKSRARTVVTVIGVVLSAALLTGVTSFGISLLDYMAKGAAERYGGWHVGFFDVSDEFVKARTQDENVLDAACAENLGYAVLEGSQNPDKPYLFVTGYNEKAFQSLPVNVISGRLPENDSEVIVSGGVQATGGVSLAEGSEITLTLGERSQDGRPLGQADRYDAQETFTPRGTRRFTVVGVCQHPQYEPGSAPGFTLITRVDNAPAASSYSVFVTLGKPSKVHSYRERTAAGCHSVLNDNVLRFMGLSGDKIFTTLMLAVGGVVIAIITIGSVFLIHNAFNISLNERTHQLGILLSVGATERQLRVSVLFEGLCIGAAGIPLGIVLGLAAIRAMIALVERNFQGLMYSNPLTLVVSPPAILAAAVIALVTILISAYIPAKKAVSVPVMDCIRQTGEIKVEAGAMKVSRLSGRLFGFEGTLALKNFKRNHKRYRSIVLSLTLSMLLFVSTNAFVIYLRQASEAAIVYTDIDLSLSAKNLPDEEFLSLYEQLKTVDSVTGSGYQEVRRYACTIPAERCTEQFRSVMGEAEEYPLRLQIQFLDEPRWKALIERAGLSEADFSGEGAPLLSTAKIDIQNRNRMIELDEFTDMFSGAGIDVTLTPEDPAAQPKAVTLRLETFVPYDAVTDITAPDDQPYFFIAAAPWEMKHQFEGVSLLLEGKGMTFQSDHPSKSEAGMRDILSGARPSAGYTLLNMSQMSSQNTNMIFIANVFAYAFIVMISLIAAANVFNTISTNIKLRRRELAMLRSVGMSDRSFQKMMNFECAFYGLRALLLGIPLSLLSSYLIYKGMFAGGAEEISLTIPWGATGISIFSILLIVFVTMLYSVSKIKKENIIDALRDDLA